MKTSSARDAILEALFSLRGKPVWHVTAGPALGATISLDIGARVQREVPLSSPHVSEDFRRFEGEFGMFVRCAWRLAIENSVVCGSLSRNDADHDTLTAVRELAGRTISDVEISPFLDVTLHFPDARFDVFCDEVDRADGWDNYHVAVADSILVVGPASEVRREPRRCSVVAPLRLV